jgi:thiol-disulfide isomerase/thioredoxin
MLTDDMRPLERVRQSMDNWSDAELGAYLAGRKQAIEQCQSLSPESFAGDDLIDLAKLCALGQNWLAANAAATRYLAGKDTARRAQAYALRIRALGQTNAAAEAARAAVEALDQLPYDAEIFYAVRYLKDDLEQDFHPAALEIAKKEHPALVEALKRNAPLKATYGEAVAGVGALYESGMELAFWQRYAGDRKDADAAMADLKTALSPTAPLTAEDRATIEATNTRYGLLGNWIAGPTILHALASPTAKPQIETWGAATVLVLFPDWCAGCRKMMKTLTEFAEANKETPIHAYGLVFEDDAVLPDKNAHRALLDELNGSSTLVVPDSTPALVGAREYPFGIVLDTTGAVRFLGPIPSDAFNGDGYISKVLVRMASTQSGPLSLKP